MVFCNAFDTRTFLRWLGSGSRAGAWNPKKVENNNGKGYHLESVTSTSWGSGKYRRWPLSGSQAGAWNPKRVKIIIAKVIIWKLLQVHRLDPKGDENN